MMSLSLVFILTACFFVIYYYLKNSFTTWKKLNIPGPKPIPLFGNFKDVLLSKVHLADFVQEVYHKFSSEPVIGLYASNVPILLVKDPGIIEEACVKNFPVFSDRGFTTSTADIDPLSQHLLYMTADKWKPMRKRLSPVFTPAKLKDMFYLVSECADNFSDYVKNLVVQSEIIDCLEITCKYTMNVIGIVAFGLETGTFSREKSQFECVGEEIFECNARNLLKRLVRCCPSWIKKLTKPIVTNEKITNFFITLVEENMRLRNTNNIRRNDFFDLLINIKNDSGKIGEEDITMTMLTAQAYVFFVAGFDTTSSTITHALYEMALNQNIQSQLYTEIDVFMQKNNGKIIYDEIKNLKYLDQVLKETLRKYPPGYFTGRRAMRNYTFSGTKITIPQGVRLFIPIHAIHNDPNIYPEPEKFDPLRFTDDAIKMRHPMTYIPFGAGPRNCIGDRFATMSIKICISKILHRFKFEVCDKTCVPYEKKIGKFLLSPNNGLFLKVTERIRYDRN